MPNKSIYTAKVNGQVEHRIYKDGEVIARFANIKDAEAYLQEPFQITKKYHFYAAHRNETLDDKCYNLHGHTYHVEVTLGFPIPDKSGIAMLFGEIDGLLEPYFKMLDHRWIVNVNDPFYQDIKQYIEKHNLKVVELTFPTSVENMCQHVYKDIKAMGLPIKRIGIRETESSLVTYE